jgi:hypothetical protein
LFSEAEHVKDVKGFWNFTQNSLLDGLYSEDWYNSGRSLPPANGRTWDFLCPDGQAPGGAPCRTALFDRGVLMENRLVVNSGETCPGCWGCRACAS